MKKDKNEHQPSSKGGIILGSAMVIYVTMLVASLIFEPIAFYVFWGAFALIIYGHVGYPPVLACLAAFRKQPVDQKAIYPTVSLVIPAYNERKHIREKITNSLSLNYPSDKLEILVASDGSTDGTNEIMREYEGQGITTHYFPRTGKLGVVNEVVSQVNSEIVVFSDANTMYHPDAIQKLVRNFHDPTVGVVSGQVILKNEHADFSQSENLYYRYERYLQERETLLGSMLGADGAMYALRKNHYSAVQGATIIDDFVIPMQVVRQGYRIVYEPEAIGYEDSAPNLKAEFSRKIRNGAGLVQMMKQGYGTPTAKQKMLWFQFFSHKFMRWVMPLALVALLLSNLRLVLADVRFGWYALTIGTQVLFYVLGICGAFFNRVPVIPVLPYLGATYVAFMIGWIKGLTNGQTATWQTFR